jgi:hypothetical protein
MVGAPHQLELRIYHLFHVHDAMLNALDADSTMHSRNRRDEVRADLDQMQTRELGIRLT